MENTREKIFDPEKDMYVVEVRFGDRGDWMGTSFDTQCVDFATGTQDEIAGSGVTVKDGERHIGRRWGFKSAEKAQE